jgi:hypothetical protein
MPSTGRTDMHVGAMQLRGPRALIRVTCRVHTLHVPTRVVWAYTRLAKFRDAAPSGSLQWGLTCAAVQHHARCVLHLCTTTAHTAQMHACIESLRAPNLTS